MSDQKNLNNIELQKSTSRRSRKDQQGRDYLCGCGKRYLSYPALYTHIKTKHDGRQPEGTQKTGTSIITKRVKCKLQDQSCKNLSQFVERSEIKLLNQLQDNMLGCISPGSRIKRDSIPKDIFQCYICLTKQSQVILTKTSNLDTVLTVYLWNMGEYVNEKLYDHYILFAKILRNCYGEMGEEIYKSCFAGKKGLEDVGSINLNEIQYVPIICDCMLRYYIPYADTSKQFKDVNLSLIELMLTDFCLWLFGRRLTPIKVNLKKEYRLESKPVPLVKHRSYKNQPKDKFKESSSGQNKKEQENSSELISQNDEDVPSDNVQGDIVPEVKSDEKEDNEGKEVKEERKMKEEGDQKVNEDENIQSDEKVGEDVEQDKNQEKEPEKNIEMEVKSPIKDEKLEKVEIEVEQNVQKAVQKNEQQAQMPKNDDQLKD